MTAPRMVLADVHNTPAPSAVEKLVNDKLKAELDQVLIYAADGKSLRACLSNAINLLRFDPAWQEVLGFNEFTLHTTALQATPWSKLGNWTDRDDSLTAEWLQRHGVMVNSNVAAEAVQVVAQDNGFHPIRDYLKALKWDGVPRIDTWLSVYLGAENNQWSQAAGSRWVLSAVARIDKPGCKADHLLLVEGLQGIGKSSAFRVLAGPDNFTDHVSELGSKDSQCEVAGVWIVEMAELARVRGARLEQVKSFLTRLDDRFRPPYGRRTGVFPRQCVFCGTTNDGNSLTDESGARRFWPIRCGKIDIGKLEADRDQLWGEAYERYKQGAVWWFDSQELNDLATAEQDQRYDVGVWDAAILEWCEAPTARNGEPIDSERGSVTVDDILAHCIGKPLDHRTQADKNAVARALIHAGYKRKQLGKGPKRGRWFYFLGD